MRNPNGYGSVYKLGGNRRHPFTAVITTGLGDDGRYIRKTLGYYVTQREAMNALANYNAKPYNIDDKAITLQALFVRWAKYREDRGKPVPSTTISAFKHCDRLCNMPFKEIESAQIQDLVDDCNNSPVVSRRVKMIFNQLYKYARLIKLTDINEAAVVEIPQMPKSKLHKPFSTEELSELWTHTDDFTARLALIYCYSGLRPGELANIERENVHLADRYMIGGMKTEAGINRTIPIAEKIFTFLSAMYERGHDEKYLLIDPDGRRLPSANAVYTRWKASAIAPIKNHLPHDGRHTCETLLDNARVAKRTIQLIMGHAGKDVDENVYTHKTIPQLIEAINLI